jgi:hypothetical protein
METDTDTAMVTERSEAFPDYPFPIPERPNT